MKTALREAGFGTLLMLSMAALSYGAETPPEHPVVPDNISPPPAPIQPLPFSHKMHITMGLTCQVCHTNPEPGTTMSYPATETCLTCHENISNGTETAETMLRHSASNLPIPWVRVYAVTPGVNWSHRSHLQAETKCTTCHGDITQTETVSETKAVLAMGVCIDCHRARQAPVVCQTCHAWPSDKDLGLK